MRNLFLHMRKQRSRSASLHRKYNPYFLNPKFQASSHLLWLYSQVCVGPGWKPRRPVYSQRGSDDDKHWLADSSIHYANTPMQYTAIFHGGKNANFQMKNYNVFLIFAQNIDCGYTLEPPQCE